MSRSVRFYSLLVTLRDLAVDHWQLVAFKVSTSVVCRSAPMALGFLKSGSKKREKVLRCDVTSQRAPSLIRPVDGKPCEAV